MKTKEELKHEWTVLNNEIGILEEDINDIESKITPLVEKREKIYKEIIYKTPITKWNYLFKQNIFIIGYFWIFIGVFIGVKYNLNYYVYIWFGMFFMLEIISSVISKLKKIL